MEEKKEETCKNSAVVRRQTPTETPTDVTKIDAEVVKPRLKNGSVFGKTPVGVWTIGSALLKTRLVFLIPPVVKFWKRKNTKSLSIKTGSVVLKRY